MQTFTKLILSPLFLFLVFGNLSAQNNYQPQQTGSINFGLGNTTLPHGDYHQIELCGCNTNLSPGTSLWKGPKKGFVWGENNQILPQVPYGEQKDTTTGETFHISKYYIASPPVFQKLAKTTKETDTLYDIGLVLPHEIGIDEKDSSQMVYLDYALLKPVYIKYLKVEFDSTFDSLDISFIPFKVECEDFPWQTAIEDKKGATGIGKWDRPYGVKENQLFLPYYIKHSQRKYLDCKVSFLNDILFHYEVYFIVDGVPQPWVNLKDYKDKGKDFTLKLTSVYQKELPAGCKPLGTKKPYKK